MSEIRFTPGARARLWRLDEHGLPTGGPIEGVFRGFMTLEEFALYEGEEMTHPGLARDVDLDGWLDRIAFHAANSERKQLGHEAARQAIAEVGRLLHGLLPAGQDKSLVYTHLKDALMYANSALAVGGGPRDDLDDDTLRRLAAHGPLEPDSRIGEYKEEQLKAGTVDYPPLADDLRPE